MDLVCRLQIKQVKHFPVVTIQTNTVNKRPSWGGGRGGCLRTWEAPSPRGCLRGALEPGMWFSGPVAEFPNRAFLRSYTCAPTVESSGKSRELSVEVSPRLSLLRLKVQGVEGRDHRTMGSRGLGRGRGRTRGARAVEAAPSPRQPGLRTGPGARAPHSGQGRPAEREPAAEEGPRATKRRVSNHAKLSNPPLPENPWGHADTEVGRGYLSAPRARDPRAEPGRLRGER